MKSCGSGIFVLNVGNGTPIDGVNFCICLPSFFLFRVIHKTGIKKKTFEFKSYNSQTFKIITIVFYIHCFATFVVAKKILSFIVLVSPDKS